MVSYNFCRICNQDFNEEVKFNRHLKSHKIKVKDYFEKFYPRKDKLTGEKIEYKDRGSLNKDFVSKDNLKQWILTQDTKTAKDYCAKLLIDRKKEKSLIYAPTQVELRSLGFPSIITYDRLHEDYYFLCDKLGFKNKYRRLTAKDTVYFYEDIAIKTDNRSILIDTREQQPLSFNRKTKIQKLPYGDYALEGGLKTFIERKSLEDFVGTMGPKNFDRFVKEIERAGMDDSQLIIVVDSHLNKCLNFDFSAKTKGLMKINSEYVFHNVRNLLQAYPFIQFLFVNGRETSSKIIQTILYSDSIMTNNIDFQLAYDYKLFS